MTLRVDYC